MKSSSESAAGPTDMKGIMRGLENLGGDTESIVGGKSVFAEFVIDMDFYIPYIGVSETAFLGYDNGVGVFSTIRTEVAFPISRLTGVSYCDIPAFAIFLRRFFDNERKVIPPIREVRPHALACQVFKSLLTGAAYLLRKDAAHFEYARNKKEVMYITG